MSRTTRLAAAACVSAILVGCGAPSAGPRTASSGGCPNGGWDAAVVWSSETAGHSELVYLHEGVEVARQELPYQGLEPVPAEAPARAGDDVWFFANGNTTRDTTHVLKWSTISCTANAYQVPEQVLWSVAPMGESFYTTHTVNAEAKILRRTADGAPAAQASLPEAVVSHLLVHDGSVYAAGTAGAPGAEQTYVFVLDADTLVETGRIPISENASLALSGVVHDNVLYLPLSIETRSDGTEGELDTLVSVDLATQSVERTSLGSPAPFVLAQTDDSLFVAHTFMNPGFRPMDAYRTVSQVVPATGRLSRFETRPGLRQVVVSDGRLMVLTQEGEGPAVVATHDLGGLSERSHVSVAPPPSGHFYLAGVLTPTP